MWKFESAYRRLHLCCIHDSLWLWSVQHTWLVVGRLVFLLISVSSFWSYSGLIYFRKGLHNSSLNAGWQQCGKLQWNVMCNVCASVGRFPAHSLSLQEKGQKTKQKAEWRHHCQYLIKPEQMQDSNVCVWITYLIYTELLAFQGLWKVGLVGGIVGMSWTRLIFPLLGRETDAVGECHCHWACASAAEMLVLSK